MYDHLGLKVRNLDASVRFYTEALAPLGYVLCSRDETGAGFGPKGEPALWLYPHKGRAGRRHAHRVPRARSCRDREVSRRGTQGRRPRQRRRRAAGRLQPDLFRGVPDRSRRQQCRGGLRVSAKPRPHSIMRLNVAYKDDTSNAFHPARTSHRRRIPTTSGRRCAISARCIGWRPALWSTPARGDARIVTFANGSVARELLVDCDEARRRLVYAIVSERVHALQRVGAGVRRRPARSRVIWIVDVLPQRHRALYQRPDGSGRIGHARRFEAAVHSA